MRINHKSDFDFRLDLYAADPYGTAVASGFPDCDFTGKLFIGPSARSRQCYIFSKRGNKLVNCFDADGHLHVVVSGHNLSTGPLYCELSLRVPDSHYPGGIRTVVYSFPLNLYLTDTDAEQISPTVSVTLPVMQKVIARPPFEDDPTEDGNDPGADNGMEDVVPPNRATARLAEPWLSPRVCGGRFRSGAYAGNIYRNEGRMYLSGNVEGEGQHKTLSVYLPRLCKLTGRSQEQILDDLHTNYGERIIYTVENDHIVFDIGMGDIAYYTTIPISAYVAISPDEALIYFDERPIEDYVPKPLTIEEIQRHFELFPEEHQGIFYVRCTSHFVIQIWKKCPNKPMTIKGKFGWVSPKVEYMKWVTKKHGKIRAARPIWFRAARKSNGKLSAWAYFKLVYNPKTNEYMFYKTNEAGMTLKNRWFE